MSKPKSTHRLAKLSLFLGFATVVLTVAYASTQAEILFRISAVLSIGSIGVAILAVLVSLICETPGAGPAVIGGLMSLFALVGIPYG